MRVCMAFERARMCVYVCARVCILVSRSKHLLRQKPVLQLALFATCDSSPRRKRRRSRRRRRWRRWRVGGGGGGGRGGGGGGGNCISGTVPGKVPLVSYDFRPTRLLVCLGPSFSSYRSYRNKHTCIVSSRERERERESLRERALLGS